MRVTAVDIAEILHGGQDHVDVGLVAQVLQGIDVIGFAGILAGSQNILAGIRPFAGIAGSAGTDHGRCCLE
jgi:hypothetical protein